MSRPHVGHGELSEVNTVIGMVVVGLHEWEPLVVLGGKRSPSLNL
jgi:hypothetical protein